MNPFPPSKVIRSRLAIVCLALVSQIGFVHADMFLNITGGYDAPLGYGGLRDGWVNSYPTGTSPYAGTLGFSFYVFSSDIQITALGYYDGPNSFSANVPGYSADGLLNAHAVGIWDGNGTLVATATVPVTGTTAVGDFQFIPISPVTLAGGGASYTLGGLVTTADSNGTGDVFFDAQNNLAVGVGPGVNIYDGPYSPVDGTTLQEPFMHAQGYLGGNFEYTFVPEPNSSGLFVSCGFVLIVAFCRRRRSSSASCG